MDNIGDSRRERQCQWNEEAKNIKECRLTSSADFEKMKEKESRRDPCNTASGEKFQIVAEKRKINRKSPMCSLCIMRVPYVNRKNIPVYVWHLNEECSMRMYRGIESLVSVVERIASSYNLHF